ncbi:MAG: PEP-CTERM sorting domain-containing protein [Pirellulales bacterium]
MRLARILFCAAGAVSLIAAFAELASAATPLVIWVEVDGSAYLRNTTSAPISFDGYQIASETHRLDPAGWKSIADYVAGGQIAEVIAALGPGGLTFGEANPGPGNLAELNLGGVGTLQPGAQFGIGKPFLDRGYVSVDVTADFFYKIGGVQNATPGDIISPDPEPSTWLLATLAALGVVATRRRWRR